MLNHITIMGRLTKDPELRFTGNQTAVASFTVAVDRDYADAAGTKQTDFIDCVAWRGTAEFINKYFSKGSMIAVDGRLQLRDWKDKNGNNRRNAEVLVQNCYFAGAKKDSTSTARDITAPADFEEVTDDIPEEFESYEQEALEDGDLPF